ncbi:response regulator [Eleftheria terrae]|uniref:response regulator n=1 Tax=Eleftheria terrae TaxID=1597781 RepID=UPI00263B9219|nr:response regulator transcription factor [Eleftheria terrae]WKB51007.1 response regulator transcription factor [Eleftheria terrae]
MLTVYLVEDDPLLARHVLDALGRAEGMRCLGHADRLAQARSELPQCRPQVLLSDLGLPDGDGTELIRELGGPASTWQPHMLVYSVFGDENRVIHAIEAGADGYFLKGCPDLELIQAIHGASQGESPIAPAIARHLLKRFAAVAEDQAERGSELSPSEQAVLKLVAQGYVSEEVAERLAMTAQGVGRQVRGIYAKLRQLHRPAAATLPG